MLRAEYERRRAGLADLQRQLAGLTATVVSKRREVSVTVGNQGVITELKFPTSAYRRLAPNELAALLTRTISEARENMLDQMAGIMAPMLPPELNAKDLLTGALSAEEIVPDEPGMPPLVREKLDRVAVNEP
jgi:hypothetical protein